MTTLVERLIREADNMEFNENLDSMDDGIALIREAIAALSGESPADKRGLAWLIEMDGPVWWAGRGHNPPEWTRDASKAVRFCRREDAEQGMWALDIAQGHMRPTEHVFLFNLSSEGSPS